MGLFCVFQTNLNKAVDILSKLPEWIGNIHTMFSYYKDLDENLACLIEFLIESFLIKGTVIQII